MRLLRHLTSLLYSVALQSLKDMTMFPAPHPSLYRLHGHPETVPSPSPLRTTQRQMGRRSALPIRNGISLRIEQHTYVNSSSKFGNLISQLLFSASSCIMAVCCSSRVLSMTLSSLPLSFLRLVTKINDILCRLFNFITKF